MTPGLGSHQREMERYTPHDAIGWGHCFQWHTWTLNLLAVEEDWQPPYLGTVKPILNVVGMPYPTHHSHRADRSDSPLL